MTRSYTIESHDAAVRNVQQRVQWLQTRQKQARIYHGASNSTRSFQSDDFEYIDISNLDHVLEVNTQEKYVLAEPNVPLDKLVAATTQAGLVPPLVAEFPGITIGGAVQGGSGESSSFRWGTFHDTCLEYEVVLGDGSRLMASRERHPDLFEAMSCSYGSLGIITMLKIHLVPATKYVRLRYDRTGGHADALARLKAQCTENVDFVDGILFSERRGVVITGTYTNEPLKAHFRVSRPTDELFYLHAGKIISRHDVYEETMSLGDYLFRYDRGGFWVAEYGFGKLPYNRLTRFMLAHLLKMRTLFRMLHGADYGYLYLTQDICLPSTAVRSFLQFSDEHFGIYPLWLCPLKPAGSKTADMFSPTALETDLVINVGLWGIMKPDTPNFTERNRQLERKVYDLGGRKVLYAHAYYTPKEFWDIYNKKRYTKLRQKYSASVVFPDIYQKVLAKPRTVKPSVFKLVKALLRSPYKP